MEPTNPENSAPLPPAARDFWLQEVQFLRKVGPRRAEVLGGELGIRTAGQLLEYLPDKYIDRRSVTKISELEQGQQTTVVGKLGRMERQMSKRSRLRTTLYDGTGYLELVWFQSIRWVLEKYKEGMEVACFGKAMGSRAGLTIAHPELEILDGESEGPRNARIVPFYSTTEAMKQAGLTSKGLFEIQQLMLQTGAQYIPETLPEALRSTHLLPSRRVALTELHGPTTPEALEQAQRRMKFEEMFWFQLGLARRQRVIQPRNQAQPFAQIGDYFNRFYKEQLPFQLTEAQKRVLREIRADVSQPIQMNRLVQGDVGSGKTMVALMAALMAVDNGCQAALMAPTEILAEQHYRTFYTLLEPLGLRVHLLTGGVKAAQRKQVLADIQTGHCHILIGTHALIEDPVKFHRLGLTLIDEQHKFGVLQRGQLWTKAPQGLFPHNLALTATPIPRTLGLTLYGDIQVSVIDELPPGRKPVRTVIRREADRLRVFGFVREELKQGRQAYFLYPLVEENEKLDLIAVTEGYEALQRAFPEFRVDLVHGRMDSAAKDFTMTRFKRGEIQILVATTVIEVGVDVPNATIMVIENAERFGLSQLHQLRGRVGRGSEQSYCVLMAGKSQLSGTTAKRLNALVESNDGFRIAEIDLQLRGPGDFLGTKQSGLPTFRHADIVTDSELIQQARAAAFEIIAQDPELRMQEHALLRQYFRHYCQRFKFEDLLA